ncbi:MAG: hypothetical protein ABIU55_13810 [Ferruginibacter sp.]
MKKCYLISITVFFLIVHLNVKGQNILPKLQELFGAKNVIPMESAGSIVNNASGDNTSRHHPTPCFFVHETLYTKQMVMPLCITTHSSNFALLPI